MSNIFPPTAESYGVSALKGEKGWLGSFQAGFERRNPKAFPGLLGPNMTKDLCVPFRFSSSCFFLGGGREGGGAGGKTKSCPKPQALLNFCAVESDS